MKHQSRLHAARAQTIKASSVHIKDKAIRGDPAMTRHLATQILTVTPKTKPHLAPRFSILSSPCLAPPISICFPPPSARPPLIPAVPIHPASSPPSSLTYHTTWSRASASPSPAAADGCPSRVRVRPRRASPPRGGARAVAAAWREGAPRPPRCSSRSSTPRGCSCSCSAGGSPPGPGAVRRREAEARARRR